MNGQVPVSGLTAEERSVAELLMATLERANDAVTITEVDPVTRTGILRFVNAAFERAAGVDRRDVLGQPTTLGLLPVGPHTDLGILATFWETAVTGGQARAEVCLRSARSGRDFWVEMHNTPILDRDGVITHHLTLARDVTERHAHVEALREREAHTRQLMDMVPFGMMLVGRDGRAQQWNRAAEVLLGFSHTEMERSFLDRTPFALVDVAGFPLREADRPVLKALRTGEPVLDVVVGLQRSGSGTVWLSYSVVPLRNGPADEPRAVLATFHDISASRAAARAASDCRRQFSLLLEAIPDPTLLVADSHIVQANAAACALLQREPAALIGVSVHDCLPLDPSVFIDVPASGRAVSAGSIHVDWPDRGLRRARVSVTRAADESDGLLVVMLRAEFDR